jgi:predicted DNA-binding transcriptional regulator YafY
MNSGFNLEVNMERNQQVIRILNVLHKMLYSRIGFTITDLADEFGVSEKTIRRDIMAIRESRCQK